MKVVLKNCGLVFASKQPIVNPTVVQIGYTEDMQYVGTSLTPSEVGAEGKAAINVLNVSSGDIVYVATAESATGESLTFKCYDSENNSLTSELTKVTGTNKYIMPSGAAKLTIHGAKTIVLAEGMRVFGVQI